MEEKKAFDYLKNRIEYLKDIKKNLMNFHNDESVNMILSKAERLKENEVRISELEMLIINLS